MAHSLLDRRRRNFFVDDVRGRVAERVNKQDEKKSNGFLTWAFGTRPSSGLVRSCEIKKTRRKSDVPSAAELLSGMPPLESVKAPLCSFPAIRKRRKASELSRDEGNART